jgi:hypothetical protein
MQMGLGFFMLWLVVFFAYPVYAQDTSDKIVDNITRVCRAPSERGKYWEVKGGGQGTAKINIKLLGEVGGTGTVTLTQGEWEGVQRVLQEKQADENARYRDCVERLTPLFLEKFVTKWSQRSQSGPDKKSTISISQHARDHSTQIGNVQGNILINPDKELTKNGPTISTVHSSHHLLLVIVDSPPPGDAIIFVNGNDISAHLKSEFTPFEGMNVYQFEGSPDQLNLSAGKNKVVAMYDDFILKAYDLKYTEMQKTEAQRSFDIMQQAETFRKR